ncbi:hypothetical protein V6B05_01430 [Lactococcus garvieae]|uniref:hypothetical protein n=1 Tax=Lactococcus garvieae TaxID=1363 RepID=UPI001F602042|nr:hypothetical protein [Lactococcus garvieae]MCI3860088.1 hypothetical protein [Lactococcus garvieae]
MIKFEVVEADSKENTITLDAGDYFNKGYVIELGEELFLPEAKPNFPINKYEEDLAKASEILNKANLPKLLDIALNAIDDAIMDIDMEAEQEWHAKITLESSLIEIAEHIENQPKLSIPKKIAEIFEKYDEREFESFEEEEFWIEENGLTKWIYDSESNQLMTAYLNPLTRPFVEVTDE